MSDPFRVELDKVHFKLPVPAGLNPFVVLGMVPLLRGTTLDHDPILVDARCDTCGVWRVQDGRHRVVASIMAGRQDILAVEER